MCRRRFPAWVLLQWTSTWRELFAARFHDDCAPWRQPRETRRDERRSMRRRSDVAERCAASDRYDYVSRSRSLTSFHPAARRRHEATIHSHWTTKSLPTSTSPLLRFVLRPSHSHHTSVVIAMPLLRLHFVSIRWLSSCKLR